MVGEIVVNVRAKSVVCVSCKRKVMATIDERSGDWRIWDRVVADRKFSHVCRGDIVREKVMVTTRAARRRVHS